MRSERSAAAQRIWVGAPVKTAQLASSGDASTGGVGLAAERDASAVNDRLELGEAFGCG